MTDLAKLSAGATQGEWIVNPFCAQIDCGVESKIGGLLPVLQLLWPTDERSEAETSANAAFITALVNAYRTGQLVERDGVAGVDLLTKAVGDIAAALTMAGQEAKIAAWTAPYVAAINQADGHKMPTDRPVTDCGDDGCGECEVCERLNFLEWAGQVAGNVPSTVERNDRVDHYIAEKYPAPTVHERPLCDPAGGAS